MKQTSIDALRSHLFEAIEGVKNLHDTCASENEKCTIEQAKSICDLSEQIIDSYKVEVEAMEILSKAENINLTTKIALNVGLIDSGKDNTENN